MKLHIHYRADTLGRCWYHNIFVDDYSKTKPVWFALLPFSVYFLVLMQNTQLWSSAAIMVNSKLEKLVFEWIKWFWSLGRRWKWWTFRSIYDCKKWRKGKLMPSLWCTIWQTNAFLFSSVLSVRQISIHTTSICSQ